MLIEIGDRELIDQVCDSIALALVHVLLTLHGPHDQLLQQQRLVHILLPTGLTLFLWLDPLR